MASSLEAHRKKMERLKFLEHAFDLDETYRQALARVQFIKTRYQKAFEPDEKHYTLYKRAKNLISRFEYAQRQMQENLRGATAAQIAGDVEGFKKYDAEYERHMKNCLYYAFGIGQLYNTFLEEAPVGLVRSGN